MRFASKMLAPVALGLALACTACSSNPLQSLETAAASVAKQAAATKTTTQAVALTEQELQELNQVAAASNLTPAQKSNVQAMLQQGIVNDQKAGLTIQQQAQNTTARLALFQALYGKNAGLLTNLNQ
jgi:hypothetical protein